jgi:glycosyltransferase involved in cell wall biosynthesis
MLFTRRLYYHVKPLLPRRLRLALRRHHVQRVLRRSEGLWPIKKGSERPPQGWPGWPNGKRFAFVLTHDVEGQHGVDRVKQLAELEMEFGFRSSFNFIPEGDYKVPAALRAWLTDRGFEVGVHDLNHDGKLYSSRDEFLRKAQRINYYLKEWNAAGFRSGFMFHNLNWIADLDIQYDASTFDTDPFEPQPDGVDTIFPFWVARSSENGGRKSDAGSLNSSRDRVVATVSDSQRQLSSISHPRSGYVELPYTLPQDSTLFKFLGRTTIDVWKKKLDWIAQHGGMALLNLHPDYVDFSGNRGCEYPAQRYREFLGYVKARYHGEYWRALPKEMASFCEAFRPTRATHKLKRICMLAYSHYESDSRIVRYSKTLTQRGDSVDVVAYGVEREPLGERDVDGVKLFKIQRRLKTKNTSPLSHLLPLLKFFVLSGVLVTRKHFRQPYDLIHVHNIPEWLVFAVSLPKLLGARILLDIHDLVPELFAAKFKTRDRSFIVPVLSAVERWSCQFSDHVIISNHLWRERLVKRSVADSKCSVFFNNIDPDLFYPRTRTRHDERKIVLFPGSLQWHQGVDIAIKAFPRVLEQCPTAEFHIYGNGGVIHELQALTSQLGLEKKVLFCRPVTVNNIPQILADADAGVVPKRNDLFGNEAYSTKIMEFMSQGIPVVLSRTAVDSYYFNENQVRFCESGDADSFAEGIIEVLTDESLRQRLVRNASTYVACNHWGSRKQDYLDLVDSLVGGVDADVSLASRRSDASTLSGKVVVSPLRDLVS